MIRLFVLSAALIVIVLAGAKSSVAAEFDGTHCFTGVGRPFHESQELASLSSFVHNGIVRTNNAQFDNVATHCEGVQRGVGATRFGYALCKVVDREGDIAVLTTQFSGLNYMFGFAEGTGKWKGIKGEVQVDPLPSPSKPAVAGSYHICTKWKGAFDVVK